MRAGFYGLALVDMQKRGAAGGGPNHWVLVAGYRERVEPFEVEGDAGASIEQELFISNSASSQPAEEWVGVLEFLRSWGGFNLFLVRP